MKNQEQEIIYIDGKEYYITKKEIQRKKNGGKFFTMFLSLVYIFVFLILLAQFKLMQIDPQLGMWLLGIAALLVCWLTLCLALVLDRYKPGDWMLYILVVIATVIGIMYYSGSLYIVLNTLAELLKKYI